METATERDVATLGLQVERLSTEVRQTDVRRMRATEAFRWTTEKMIHAERLRRTLRSLEGHDGTESTLRNLDTKLEDAINTIKTCEKRRTNSMALPSEAKGLAKSFLAENAPESLMLRTPTRGAAPTIFVSPLPTAKVGQSFSGMRSGKRTTRFQAAEVRGRVLEDRTGGLNATVAEYGTSKQRREKDSLQKENERLREEVETLSRTSRGLRTEIAKGIDVPRPFGGETEEDMRRKMADMGSKIGYLTQELSKEKSRSKMLLGELERLKAGEEMITERANRQEADLQVLFAHHGDSPPGTISRRGRQS